MGIVAIGFAPFAMQLAARVLNALLTRQLQHYCGDAAGVRAIGVTAPRLCLAALPIVGFQIVAASYFQAVGKPRQAMLLMLSRQVLLLIPAILILPRFFGLRGIYYAVPLADLGSALLTGIWLARELRRLDRQHGEQATEVPQAAATAPAG